MDNITKSPPSTEWSELFAQNPSHEPTTYKALDNLASHDDLAFLHAKFWNEIREWTRNDITEMSRIVHPELTGPGSIFIGGMNHALNEDTLAKNDIQAVIAIHPKDSLAWDKNNTSYGLQRFYPNENGMASSVVKYPLIIPLEDNANSNLIDHFDETNEFIKRHSCEGKNILIHCKSGRSRSVAVLIAYLQQKFCSEKGLASLKDKTVAKEQMRIHSEEITEAIRTQRLPVIVIMERFNELLARYDLKLIEDPEYRSEKANGLSAPEVMDSKTPTPGKQPELVAKKESKVVQTKGGAAVLKICVAAAFFKNQQKPTEPVTASDDSAKLTSWGCDTRPTTYIIGPLQAEQTASATASTNDKIDSGSGLSKDATIAIAVVLPVIGLAILVAAAMLFIRRRKKKTSIVFLTPGERARSKMGQTTECAPAPAPPSYEMGDDAVRPELDSHEVR
nr:hypothetical protein FVER53263_08376 [Fusarium verticillioides]